MQKIRNIREKEKKIYKLNDKYIREKNIEKHLLKSEEDIIKGRVKEAETVFSDWKAKYGI